MQLSRIVRIESWINAEPEDVYSLLTNPSSLLDWLNGREEPDRALPAQTMVADVEYRSMVRGRSVTVTASPMLGCKGGPILEFSLSSNRGGTRIELISKLSG